MLLSRIIIFAGLLAMRQILPAGALPTQLVQRNATAALWTNDPDIALIDCHYGDWWGDTSKEADITALKEGITYLETRRFDHKPRLGPGHCERVSCSWGAAIIWCNLDKTNPKELSEGYDIIGRAAQAVLDKCDFRNECANPWICTRGQVYMKDWWSITVTHNNC